MPLTKSRDSVLVARFSTPVYTILGARPCPYTMGTETFAAVKRPKWGLDNHLAPRLKK